jgi:Secretion system C-terminal sorting domain
LLTIHPNPTNSSVNISANDNVLIRECALIDVMGRTVQQSFFDDTKSAYGLFEDIGSGVYLLRILTSSGLVVNKKIVISR